ncbi:MAG: hypothetical protein ACE37K_12270 [Planctomycetota bacterium]
METEITKVRRMLKLSLIGIVLAWATCLPLTNYLATEPGQVGDTFGSVNSLFTGLALAGVVAAIGFQSVELRALRRSQKDAEQAQADAHRLLTSMAEAMVHAKEADVLMHCNHRYADVWASQFQPNSAQGYWDRFLNLQFDQFTHYRAGLIPDIVWHYWIKCRYQDYRNENFKVNDMTYRQAWEQAEQRWTDSDFLRYFRIVHENEDPEAVDRQASQLIGPRLARLAMRTF